jgi:hypothetical protein
VEHFLQHTVGTGATEFNILYTPTAQRRGKNTENLKSEDQGEECGDFCLLRHVKIIEICAEYLLI